MNRSITNVIRYFMDECFPAIIRDNKYFMYPFYFFAYRGRNIKQVMDFKKEIHYFSSEQYEHFYNNLNSISRNRITDLNQPSLQFILKNLIKDAVNLADIGCGNGYLLKQIKKHNQQIELTGCDLKEKDNSAEYKYVKANIERLPFEDNSFDIVTCSHTLEHIVHPEKAISELKRIARKQVIIAVPCQRYFYYTLDEHVNFFPFKETLTSLINIQDHSCKKIHGDWVYLGLIAE